MRGRSQRSTLLVAIAIVLSLAHGQTLHCERVTEVETVGLAAAGERGALGTNAAVLDALAQAVTQVRGSFIQVESRLEEVFRERFSDGELTTYDESTLARTIEERASGLVLGYSVQGIDESGGLVAVRVRASVCADARLAIEWFGPTSGRSAFEAGLAVAFGRAGWHVVRGATGMARDLVAASLDTGASHLATVTVTSHDRGAYRGVRAFDVDFDVRVEDVTGRRVVAGLRHTENIAARNAGEAEALAAEDAAVTLANAILLAIGDGAASTVGTLFVDGARRPNTVIELERLLLDLPGVVGVRIEDRGATLRYAIDTARGMCAIATDLADQRRILTQVDGCDDGTATLRILRE